MNIKKISNYFDILGIICFLLFTYYFYQIENKSIFEHILLFLSISGLVLDIIFTYIFFKMK